MRDQTKPLYPYHYLSLGVGALILAATLFSAVVGLRHAGDFASGAPMRVLALCVGLALLAWPALRVVEAPIFGLVAAVPAVLLVGLVGVKYAAAQHQLAEVMRSSAVRALCEGGPALGAHDPPPRAMRVRWLSNRRVYEYEPGDVYLDAYRSTSEGWPTDVIPDYVVCAGVRDEVVQEAPYTRQGSTRPITLRRIQQRLSVRVIETTTGRVLGERVFTGSVPAGFPSVIRPGQDTHLIGEPVSLDAMRAFVAEVVPAG